MVAPGVSAGENEQFPDPSGHPVGVLGDIRQGLGTERRLGVAAT